MSVLTSVRCLSAVLAVRSLGHGAGSRGAPQHARIANSGLVSRRQQPLRCWPWSLVAGHARTCARGLSPACRYDRHPTTADGCHNSHDQQMTHPRWTKGQNTPQRWVRISPCSPVEWRHMCSNCQSSTRFHGLPNLFWLLAQGLIAPARSSYTLTATNSRQRMARRAGNHAHALPSHHQSRPGIPMARCTSCRCSAGGCKSTSTASKGTE